MRAHRNPNVCLITAVTFLLLQAPVTLAAKEQITDAMAHEVRTLALKGLHLLMCSEGKLCTPATESEFRHPPVSIEDTRRAMSIGLISGVAERCGVDWNENFFAPLMRYFRHQVRMNERQLALIAFIHGTQQSRAFKSTPDDMCTAAMKERLSNSVAR